tara:strand:+ start:898 stop:2076 length:1179 start_codon:yes stop_codon:yes gene_type:complete
MKFDFLTSNPAFNISEENNIAGTGGNTNLYRTATRHDYKSRLKPGGVLANITLKGMIPDLVSGHFKNRQVHNINLMDDIDVWPYNTCYFFVENTQRHTNIQYKGGLASKIYTTDPKETFPFTYYSGNNRGMKGFSTNGANKVIRQLPGKGRDSYSYDHTDKQVPAGPKFAFYVMESKKSYSVTDQPIMGGTICYIATATIEQAEKLKLFTLHNDVYKEYVQRMKFKYHAFGLRYVRSFDIDQIVTGKEIPVEWNISEDDIRQPEIIHNENVVDVDKKKDYGQVFTPSLLVKRVLSDLEKIKPDAFSDPAKTFCDSMCGNGKFLEQILDRKMSNGISHEDAVKTIYGCDIDQDAVNECRKKLSKGNTVLTEILQNNIRCADTFKENFGIKFDL